ncbi:MAG: outer rane efflux protein [Chthonomonadaceae bacterium]|nr:outer rane efflux protein [Chthonomonadaceae bacterium]
MNSLLRRFAPVSPRRNDRVAGGTAMRVEQPIASDRGWLRPAGYRMCRAALWGVFTIAGVSSAGQRLVAQQAVPPVSPNVVNTPVPPPVILPGPPPAGTPSRPLSADEAARIALRLQPNIAVARAGITVAQGITQQARSGLNPQVNVGLSYNTVQTLSGTGTSVPTTNGGSSNTSSGLTGAVSVQQLIYDFNHTRDLVREEQALEQAATQNLSVVQQVTVFQVKQAFYQYVQFRQFVAINEENVHNRQDQLALANARFKSGLGLAADVATAQTAVAVAVESLILTRNNAETARVNLALLMGIDPRTPIQPAVSDEPPVTSDDVNSFVRKALVQRPEILQAQATIRAGEYAVRSAKTTNAPVVVGTLGIGTRGDQFFPQNDTATAGVALQFPLYDGGLTAGRVKAARGNLEGAQAQLRSVELTVTSDVSQAYLDLRSAEQRVSAAGGEVANAQEGIRIATGRYRAGLGLFLDILNAQQFLYTAETDQATALYTVQQARAMVARAMGAPIP